jgi:hypothetical protein
VLCYPYPYPLLSNPIKEMARSQTERRKPALRSSIDRSIDRSRVDSQDVLMKKQTVWCLGLPTTRPSGGLVRLLFMLVGELDIENDPATYSMDTTGT